MRPTLTVILSILIVLFLMRRHKSQVKMPLVLCIGQIKLLLLVIMSSYLQHHSLICHLMMKMMKRQNMRFMNQFLMKLWQVFLKLCLNGIIDRKMNHLLHFLIKKYIMILQLFQAVLKTIILAFIMSLYQTDYIFMVRE